MILFINGHFNRYHAKGLPGTVSSSSLRASKFFFVQIGILCFALVGLCYTAPYSGNGGYGSSSGGASYGGSGGGASFGGSGLSLGGYGGGGGGGGGGQEYGGQPQVIEVSPEQLPVQVHFRTASSRVNVQQSHNPSMAPQVEHASFQDEPHRVVHEVGSPFSCPLFICSFGWGPF